MNLEQLTNISIDTNKTKDIANLCNELISQNKIVEQAETALKNAKSEQLRLSEEVIPAVMSEAGISMLKLEDGSSVEVAPYYYAKIPEDKKIKYTKVIRCPMDLYQFNTYYQVLKNDIKSKVGGILSGTTQASNIVFPSRTKIGDYGSDGFGILPVPGS